MEGARKGPTHREGHVSPTCWVPTLFQAQPRGVSSVWQPATLFKLCWAGRVELGGPAWRPAVIRKSFHSQMGKFCQHIVPVLEKQRLFIRERGWS